MQTSGTHDQAPEHLAGLVERVTFHSEESGFAVIRVKARGHRELVALVGTVPSITAGEWIEAEGVWAMDPKHGPQFKAATLQTTQPDTMEGIEKYLGSGLIKGIGPVYAAKLVAAFGKEVFDVIDNRSALLERVEGIGPQRRARIRAAWKEQKGVREIMTFLFSHGVSTARAFRIYKAYGEEAIPRVRLDPYCLARDIHGIGFQTADRIAESVGIPRDSDLRARAGIEHALQELTNSGHCAYPRGQLVDAAARMLGMDDSMLDAAIAHLVKEGRLVERQADGSEMLVYLAVLDQAERRLSRDLVHLAFGAYPLQDINIDKAVDWVEGQTGLQLAEAQSAALRTALTSKVMVITGGPGVGKTTLVNAIVKIARAKKLKVQLCAPTGRAAKRLMETSSTPARTIHRLLEFDPKTGDFKHDARTPLKGDLFIDDETSMIDLPLAHKLIRAIPRGAALILVGDVDQLPSVGPGCVLRDIIDSDVLPVCRLTHIFRQAAASRIITNAHRINEGNMPVFPEGKQAQPDSDFYFAEADEPDKAARLVVKLVSQTVPQRFGFNARNDIQVLTPMQRGELGARNLNTTLQEALNPGHGGIQRFGWTYRTGDKVMQLQNDYDKDVFNGDVGRITAINEEDREITVRFDRRDVSYDFHEMDELTLAYASTIHKSQGSEYPCVIIPIHTQHYVLLQRNLLYTAITRGRKLVVIVGSKKALAIAVKNVDAHNRITTLKERLIAAAAPKKEG